MTKTITMEYSEYIEELNKSRAEGLEMLRVHYADVIKKTTGHTLEELEKRAQAISEETQKRNLAKLFREQGIL